jgi:hypothetical protein
MSNRASPSKSRRITRPRTTSKTLICAVLADLRGDHADWPTWRMGRPLQGSWEWLFERVTDGSLPDIPCRWCDVVGPDRSVIYWLDTRRRTRHLIVGYGCRILTGPADFHEPRRRMH